MCADALMARTRGTTALIFGLVMVASCHTPSAAILATSTAQPPGQPAGPAQRCRTFAGPTRDPDLDGQARNHPVRCCPSGYGFDPELARTSCGFEEYLGESEELACVHRFTDGDGRVHELRITPMLELELGDAIVLHESGAFGPDHVGEAVAGQPELWWSADAGRRWALVSGWSMVRRLGWNESSCAPERMQPVLARMLDAREDPAAAVALPRLATERPSEALADASLRTLDFDPRPHDRHYPLPRAAAQLIHDLLGAAVSEDLPSFTALLEPNARIGLPDRRQVGARAVLADGGPAAAARRLRDAAARLPATTPLRCPELDRRVEPRVTRGEAPMWCFWMSEDGLDVLAFALRGRISDEQPDARVAYLGMFPVRPALPLEIPGDPPPPPVVPMPELVCGDPHASSYPGVCPEPESRTPDAGSRDRMRRRTPAQ